MGKETIIKNRISYGVFDKRYLDERLESQMLVDDKTAIMSQKELNVISEYSCTIPTGAYLGKRWKRALYGPEIEGKRQERNGKWIMGEYAPNPDPKIIDIIWRNIEVVNG